MNILFYCDEYPPATTGGIGNVTKIIAEALVKRGHRIYVVGYYPYSKGLPHYSIINGVAVYRLNLGFRNGKFRYIFSLILCKLRILDFILRKELIYTENFIEELIEDKHIDILELTDFYYFNLSSKPLPFRKFKVPTILRIHGSISFLESLMGKERLSSFKNDNLHFLRCNYISAVSKYSLNYIEENFSTKHFLSKAIIYNPLEESFLNETFPSKNKTILFIGKLTKTKGCYSLLKAFNSIAAIHKDWHINLIGGGDIHKAKSFVDSRYLDRVHFLGFCSRERIKEEIDKCSFACIPSFFENFSIAAMEIMARQKALIFTNRTSGPEIIDNEKDGLLVNPENLKDLANALNVLINNPYLRDHMANKAYFKIKENFTTNTILNQIEELYVNIKQSFTISN